MLCQWGLCVFSCLIFRGEKSSPRFFFIIASSSSSSPKPGLRVGDKSLLFQCCKKDYGRFQQNLQAEKGEQECCEQHELKAGAVGVARAAVHLVLLTDAHLNFELCVVGQRGHP